MNTARIRLGGAGTQTAALAFGGNDGTPNTAATEEFTITGNRY
jgi:xanthine dehydrogenase iron-sulfur cluster and FAD-binding subunit A